MNTVNPKAPQKPQAQALEGVRPKPKSGMHADPLTIATGRDKAMRMLRLRAGESSPYHRILGRIPAEESDEEFLAAVEAMS